MQMSHPWLSQPMVYGLGRDIIVSFNCLMTSINIRLFYLPLSRMKWIVIPFLDICEWKGCSPSSGSLGSSQWNFVVEMVTLGSASMIHFPLSSSKSRYELTSDSDDFISSNNDCLEWHSSMLCQGILWNSHHFLVSFFHFMLPLFACGLDWLS